MYSDGGAHLVPLFQCLMIEEHPPPQVCIEGFGQIVNVQCRSADAFRSSCHFATMVLWLTCSCC
mgnify:CR=1 FL=1